MTGSRPSSFTLTSAGPVRLWSTDELLRLPSPEWLIDTIIPMGGLAALYAEPGSGKTFLALDMALSVATGCDWQGHPCQRGYVLYISAEGGTGIAKRVQAWLNVHQCAPRDARVAWLIESIPLHNDSEQITQLVDRIDEEVEVHPVLIVVDTLARCFDGDENTQLDMGRFIAGVDHLRRKWNSTVLVVHHTRLDGDRERGNTAFRGAADTMLRLSRAASAKGSKTTRLSLLCNKQKDAEEFKPIALRLVVVPEVDSCVIEGVQLSTAAPLLPPPEASVQVESTVQGAPREYSSAEKQARMIDYLLQNQPVSIAVWRAESGLTKPTFYRTLSQLKQSLIIVEDSSGWRLA